MLASIILDKMRRQHAGVSVYIALPLELEPCSGLVCADYNEATDKSFPHYRVVDVSESGHDGTLSGEPIIRAFAIPIRESVERDE